MSLDVVLNWLIIVLAGTVMALAFWAVFENYED